jgi:hypothetical protein
LYLSGLPSQVLDFTLVASAFFARTVHPAQRRSAAQAAVVGGLTTDVAELGMLVSTVRHCLKHAARSGPGKCLSRVLRLRVLGDEWWGPYSSTVGV